MYNHAYEHLLTSTLESGVPVGDRTGTGTYSVFGRQIRYDLSQGFPLITTKKVAWKAIVHELLWFLRGDTNIKYLKDNGVKIWDEWADKNGDLGPIYSHQWLKWPSYKQVNSPEEAQKYTEKGYSLIGTAISGKLILYKEINQIKEVIDRIKTKPDCRRLLVSAWNVGEIDEMALPPCHTFFQFKVYDGKLSCQLYQRSADLFLGVPFNIASYALLTHMIAQVCGLQVGDFVHSFGDAHVYQNHIEAVNTQRQHMNGVTYDFPQIKLNPEIKDIFDFQYSDIELVGYQSHPVIKAPVSI